ncbi:MAG: septum formation initiator family protein [Acidobacteriota bacterium]
MTATRVQPPVPRRETRKGYRGRRTVVTGLAFVVCFLVVSTLVGDSGLVAVFRAEQQRAELANDVERIRLENERLREQVRRLRDDPAAIEEIARRELGLIKPGERVFIIRDITPGATR